MEANVIEFWFYSILNLTVYPNMSDKTLWNTLSFAVAFYILCSSTYNYGLTFLSARSAISQMS